MFGDGIGRQQPQQAFDVTRLGFARLILSAGGSEGAGENDRQRETQ